MKKVLYTAAHSGFNLRQVPLGGGASVCEHLREEWRRQKPFEFEVLGPALLNKFAPLHKDLVQYSELEYARFCLQFEKHLTASILKSDPKDVVILSNDVSEGPDFKMLAAKGYSVYTIYHVDVVDYFTTIYLRAALKPETTTAIYRGITRLGLTGAIPNVLKLIWEKQEASVRHSKGLIVPSQRMKEVLLRCYPELEPSRVHVLPWGVWEDRVNAQEIESEKQALLKEFPMESGAPTLLMLSRVSPEKGQDRLLKALALWEEGRDFPKEGISLLIAGEPAYMLGQRFERKLKNLTSKLKRSRVHFVGYAAGARKKALFELADLYVFPSRHESYGLTLLEALREGKPVLATASYGAEEVFKVEFGELVPNSSERDIAKLLMSALTRLLLDRGKLKRMGKAAATWSRNQDFSVTAATLAGLLR